MDLYFKRHDGQAVTCEDFYAAMRDANDVDFANFLLWCVSTLLHFEFSSIKFIVLINITKKIQVLSSWNPSSQSYIILQFRWSYFFSKVQVYNPYNVVDLVGLFL